MSHKPKLTAREHKAKVAAKKKRAILNARCPEEWRSAIDTITDPSIKIQAACIVWWDYFAHREVSDRWPHLDECVQAWNVRIHVPQSQFEAALLSIGYLPEDARSRSTLPTTMRKVSSDDESE